jgi:hypothetical protein
MSRMMAGTDRGPELTLDRHDDYRTYNADPESLRAAASLASAPSRVAFSSIALNTRSSSPGELEMTRNTSAVAVCCSSASASSRVNTSGGAEISNMFG